MVCPSCHTEKPWTAVRCHNCHAEHGVLATLMWNFVTGVISLIIFVWVISLFLG